MNSQLTKIKRLTLASTLAYAIVSTLACTKGGGGGISEGGSSGGGGAGSDASIGITKIYPTSSGPSWTAIVSGGRTYVRGMSLSVKGSCSRGIDKIRVHEGVLPDYAETATCGADGTWTWTKNYGAGQSDKTLSFQAYDVSDTAIAGVTATTNIRIDSIAPSAVVITDPASSPFQYTGNSTTYDVIGTCDADTYRIATDGGVDITPTGVNWTHTVALTQNSTLDYHFYARDLAGNVAPLVTQQVLFSPAISAVAVAVGAGGVVTGTSSFGLESVITWDPGTVVSTTPGGGSAFHLDTGFNYVTQRNRELTP